MANHNKNQQPAQPSKDELAALRAENDRLKAVMEEAAAAAKLAAKEAAEAKTAAAAADLERRNAEVALAEARGETLLPANSKATEVQPFWLTNTRYLQQVGERSPRLVTASNKNPVLVKLPKFITRPDKDGVPRVVLHPEDRHLKRIKPRPPAVARAKAGAIKPVRTGANPVEPLPDLPEAEEEAAATAPAQEGVRAADQ